MSWIRTGCTESDGSPSNRQAEPLTPTEVPILRVPPGRRGLIRHGTPYSAPKAVGGLRAQGPGALPRARPAAPFYAPRTLLMTAATAKPR